MAEIELLTLANHAEVQNGLLYMLGSGWDTVTRSYERGATPQPQHMSIAMSVLVPWMEMDQKHRVTLSIEDEDARTTLMEATADLEIGRGEGRVPGSDSRAPIAMTGLIHFPASGGYRVRARLGDRERFYAFRVVDNVTEPVISES